MTSPRIKTAALVSLLVALIIRIIVGISHPLPYGDGGLWFVVSEALTQNDFRLPHTIIFNGESFPFCYPPLAGYMLAITSALFNIPTIGLIAKLPALLNMIAVGCFFLLATRIINDKRAAIIAMLLFPLATQSYEIFLAGGGVSRNLGLVFQILTWWVVSDEQINEKKKNIILAGVLNGLAILSHPTGGFWSCLGIVVLTSVDKKISPRTFLTISVISAIAIAPWLMNTLPVHGFIPFLSAFKVSGDEMFSWKLFATPERLLLPGQFIGTFALLGLLLLIRQRKLLLPVIFLITLAIDHRGLFVLNGVVLGVLAAGVGLSAVISVLEGKGQQLDIFTKTSTYGFISLLLLHLTLSNYLVIEKMAFSRRRPTQDDFNSYTQLKRDIHPSQKILFVRSQKSSAEPGEWMSALSGHTIYPLPQGQEWSGKYGEQIDALNKVSACCDLQSRACVESTVARYQLRYDTIAIDNVSCSGVIDQYIRGDSAAEIKVKNLGNLTLLTPAVKAASID